MAKSLTRDIDEVLLFIIQAPMSRAEKAKAIVNFAKKLKSNNKNVKVNAF